MSQANQLHMHFNFSPPTATFALLLALLLCRRDHSLRSHVLLLPLLECAERTRSRGDGPGFVTQRRTRFLGFDE